MSELSVWLLLVSTHPSPSRDTLSINAPLRRSSGFAASTAVDSMCLRITCSGTNGLRNRTSLPATELTPTPVGAPMGLTEVSVENSPSTAAAASRVRTEKHTRRPQLSRVLVGILSAVGRCVLRMTTIPADLPRFTRSRTIESISAPTAFASFVENDLGSRYVWHSSITTTTAGCKRDGPADQRFGWPYSVGSGRKVSR